MIDLRSDTVTRPTQAMWDVMHNAPVGDDVFGEDPGLNALEKTVADMFGMEEGVFVPSGTMGNQLGLKVHTCPADEVILDEKAHIFHSEGAAPGLISGIQLRPVRGERGVLSADTIASAIRTRNDWDPHTRVVALENSSNLGGGTCYSLSGIRDIYQLTRKHGLALHIDGARIWNACIATDTRPEQYGEYCDTISVCFSKGLGAPVGSMVLGSSKLMKQARRYRKILGGGMRQAGMLAAAADHAVKHHFTGLKEDHDRAKTFAEAIDRNTAFRIQPDEVETNIVLFGVQEGKMDEVLAWFSDHNIAMIPFGHDIIRATFHYEVTDENLESVLRAVATYTSP